MLGRIVECMDSTTLNSLDILLIVLLVLWSFAWKGWALWRAAGNKDKAWYLVLLILNTAGLLDIAYLFIFSKRSKNNK